MIELDDGFYQEISRIVHENDEASRACSILLEHMHEWLLEKSRLEWKAFKIAGTDETDFYDGVQDAAIHYLVTDDGWFARNETPEYYVERTRLLWWYAMKKAKGNMLRRHPRTLVEAAEKGKISARSEVDAEIKKVNARLDREIEHVWLQDCLRKLPPRLRKTMRRLLKGQEIERLARELGKTLRHIYAERARGVTSLQECIKGKQEVRDGCRD